MAVSLVPALITALVAQATAALASDDVLVVDGVLNTDDANPDILMIGADDPSSGSAAESSTASQVMATAGTPRSRDDSGTVTCAAQSWSGDSDQADARARAYASFEAVAGLLRTDPTLGLGAPGRVVCQVAEHRLYQYPWASGCEATVVFTVAFTARI